MVCAYILMLIICEETLKKRNNQWNVERLDDSIIDNRYNLKGRYL